MRKKLSIVMYHYVRPIKCSRYADIRGLELSGFRRQLDHLQSQYTIIRMEDLIEAVRTASDLPNNAALLTFDDGYVDHYSFVFPELFERGLQGSFFPPVEPLCEGKLLDVNRIHYILAQNIDNPERISAQLDAAVRDAQAEWGLDTVEEYRSKWATPNRFDNAEMIYIKRMLQTGLPEALRNRIAQQLFAHFVGIDEATFAGELYMDEKQAKLMQSCGMYFGSHGASHYWLNNVSHETQVNEIDKSLEFLRRIGSPVDEFWVMCYPYGAWNANLLDLLRAKECVVGLTTDVAMADLSVNDPLRLPRYDTNDFPR